MAESEQIWWTYVKLENRAEIYSARIYSNQFFQFTNIGLNALIEKV